MARDAPMKIFGLWAVVVVGASASSEVSGFCEFVVFAVCVFVGGGRNSVDGFLRLRVLRTDEI